VADEQKVSTEQLVKERAKLRDALEALSKVDIPERSRGTAMLKDLREVVREQIDELTDRIDHRRADDDIPPNDNGWHPNAHRQPEEDAGAFTSGGHKIVWHTTEGSSFPDYAGVAPHFTLNPQTGELRQHMPITVSARALVHPAGTPETNRCHSYQVELIGFAAHTQDWPDLAYERIAKLARWIEKWADVPRTSDVKFEVPAARMGGQEFVDYKGHCGHEHVPGNTHWDPGAFKIGKVI
jgi:hypothetical protein